MEPEAGEEGGAGTRLWEAADIRLFISHDVERHGRLGLRIARDIEGLGGAAWLSSRDIAAGEPWQSTIEKALYESTHMIVLVDTAEPGSWVNEEVAMGRERDLAGPDPYPIIPVVVEPDAQLPRQLSRRQAVDVSSGYAEGLMALATRLGLEAAMGAFQHRLLTGWGEGFSVLRRHAEVLRGQMNRLRLAIEAEQHTVHSRAADAESAAAEADKLRRSAISLEAQARKKGALADAAEKQVEKATREHERAKTILAELQLSAAEVAASHQPVLAKIDQAEELLTSARQSGALSVDRDGDVVALLENPTHLVAALDEGKTQTFDDLRQEHNLRGLLLRVVEQSTASAPDLRDTVLARAVAALAVADQASIRALVMSDGPRGQDLAGKLTEAIELYVRRQRTGYDAVDVLEAAMHEAFTQVLASRDGPVQTSPAPPAVEARARFEPRAKVDQRFDVVVTGVPNGLDRVARDQLAQLILVVTRASVDPPDVIGFFTARRVATGELLPCTVLRQVEEATAHREVEALRAGGAEAVVRSVEGPDGA